MRLAKSSRLRKSDPVSQSLGSRSVDVCNSQSGAPGVWRIFCFAHRLCRDVRLSARYGIVTRPNQVSPAAAWAISWHKMVPNSSARRWTRKAAPSTRPDSTGCDKKGPFRYDSRRLKALRHRFGVQATRLNLVQKSLNRRDWPSSPFPGNLPV